MAYDANGHLTETISPSAGTTLQYYDHDGNLTENIAADDSSIVNTYDADDRLTQAIWYSPSGTVVDTQNRTYDNDGDLLTASNINGTYTFSYDADNRLTNVQEPYGVSLSYSYDGDGNQTQVVDSFGGTETSIYDVQDRLVTREYTGEEQNLRVDFTYAANGQIATQTDYSNLAGTAIVSVTDTEYDADGNVLDIHSYNASDATIEHFAYTYDPADNLHAEVDTQGGVTTTTVYTYDPANQLTGAGAAAFSYDGAGNRDSTGYTTVNGEMMSDGTYDYTYDAKGNEQTKTDIATGDKWTYEYNNANEMISAVETTSAGAVEQTVDFGYDIFGNRTGVETTVGDVTTITRYGYDMWNPAKAGATGTSGSDIWATFTSGDSLTMRELQGDGLDQHLAYVAGSNAYWYLTDHLNSIRAVLNSSGGVTASVAYDAYGNLTTAAAPGLYDWTGRELDVETGLQYNRARYYDSETGRWISQDPLGFDAGDSNLYRYVNNAPTNHTDPSGLVQNYADTRANLLANGWKVQSEPDPYEFNAEEVTEVKKGRFGVFDKTQKSLLQPFYNVLGIVRVNPNTKNQEVKFSVSYKKDETAQFQIASNPLKLLTFTFAVSATAGTETTVSTGQSFTTDGKTTYEVVGLRECVDFHLIGRSVKFPRFLPRETIQQTLTLTYAVFVKTTKAKESVSAPACGIGLASEVG